MNKCAWAENELVTCNGLSKAIQVGAIKFHAMQLPVIGAFLGWTLEPSEAPIEFCPFCGGRIALL